MFSVSVPYKDYNGKVRNEQITFLLEVRDVYKLLTQLNFMLNWRDKLKEEDDRDLDTDEVSAYFNNFEEVLLASYGQISEDGKEFDRSDSFRFERSKAFAALMEMFLKDLGLLTKMLEEIMPEGMEDIIKSQEASLANVDTTDNPALQAEIDRLQAEIDKAKLGQIEAAPEQ